jgi:hypothetical protein
VSSSVVLIACTILALIFANIPLVKDWYFSLWQHPMAVSVGGFNLFSHGGHSMNVMMVINDRNIWRPVTTQLHIMNTLNRLYPGMINFDYHELSRVRMGTDEICNTLKENRSLLPVIEKWKNSAKEFEKIREKYLLY